MNENVCDICDEQMEMRYIDSMRWFWFCRNCDQDEELATDGGKE